jgi:hypothetical protein
VLVHTDQPKWWLAMAEFHTELNDAAQSERPGFIDGAFSYEIMRNPAMLMSGPPGNREALNTYEYDDILRWFASGGNKDPITNVQVSPAQREIVRDPRYQREIRDWCEQKVHDWRQELAKQPVASYTTAHDATKAIVHVFVDHSNVTLGASRAGTAFDAATLVRHVERGREVHERAVVGSHESERTRAEWEQLGYVVNADPRRGKEHFVDDALHAQLMRTAGLRFDPPHVVALVTGDGNRNDGRTTFPECIEAALKNDWHVELYSWRQSTSGIYIEMARMYADHFCVRYLDDIMVR